MNLTEWALSMIEKNPNIKNNPNAKAMIEVIKANDQAKGEQIANNLIQSMGVSREDAISQAKGYFGL